MVWVTLAKIGVQEWLAARLLTLDIFLYRHKNGIELGKKLGVVGLDDPAAIALAIEIKKSKTDGMARLAVAVSPRLEDAGVVHAGLLVQVKGIEDQRFPFG